MARMLTARTATAGALCLLIPLAIVGSATLVDRNPVTRAAYDKINLGMSRGDVEQLFGSAGIGPNEVTRPPEPERKLAEMVEEGPFDNRPDDNEPGRRMVWTSRDASILVRFGQGDKVTDKVFMRLEPLSWMQRVRHLVKL